MKQTMRVRRTYNKMSGHHLTKTIEQTMFAKWILDKYQNLINDGINSEDAKRAIIDFCKTEPNLITK
jgi:hypothetical protein